MVKQQVGMFDDDFLGVCCVKCRKLSWKAMWSIRGGRCPECYPGFRGSIGLYLPLNIVAGEVSGRGDKAAKKGDKLINI